MKSKAFLCTQLNDFIQKDKFSRESWNNRGLIPSETKLSNYLNRSLNGCAKMLMQLVNRDGTKKELKKALKIGLKNLKKGKLDTEEKEIVCDYFFDLSEIVEIDFSNNLNTWLYGRFFSLMVRLFGKK